jgi:hypothetical protein
VRGNPNKRRTTRSVITSKSPPEEGYEWLFGNRSDLKAVAEHDRHKDEQRKRASERRKEGYEWLFE